MIYVERVAAAAAVPVGLGLGGGGGIVCEDFSGRFTSCRPTERAWYVPMSRDPKGAKIFPWTKMASSAFSINH